MAALLATLFSGASLIVPVQAIYSAGLSRMVVALVGSAALWMTSLVWVRMIPFMQHLSIAETIGSIYGKYPRVIVALLDICTCVIYVVVQINATSLIISTCMDLIDPKIVTILSTLVLIVYATLGGIRSVTNSAMYCNV